MALRREPHGRLKDAAKIEEGAKLVSMAPVVVPTVSELWQWTQEERAHGKGRRLAAEIRRRYAQEAQQMRERLNTEYATWAAKALAPFEEELARGRGPVTDVATAREATRQRLAALSEAIRGPARTRQSD